MVLYHIFLSAGVVEQHKCITMNNDFIRLLKYSDVVLADRDFDIADDIAVCGASLIIPEAKSNLACRRLSAHRKLPRFKYMLRWSL